MALLLTIILPLLLCWAPLLGSRVAGRHASAWLAGLVTLGSIAMLAVAVAGQPSDAALIVHIPWMPSLGLHLNLRLDGLSLLMCMLVLGIGELVIVYARYYLADDDHRDRFFAFLLLFMGAMLGVVTAENLLSLVVFWELTSVSSFLLVAFKNDKAAARRGARRALGVTGLGGLCLLGGVLLLGEIVGSYELSAALAAHDRIVADPRYPYALVLILLGVFTKSAQVPFHFWLPGAMSAPTPASAYLHSATMVKAGVFLLVRLWPALSGTELWFWLVTGVGLATMLFGAVVALFQDDIKGLLAYSTISHLGLITALFGLNSTMGVVAGIFHIINHATFKASLFMAAGIIDHETGTRDLNKLGGLARHMKSTAVLATVASAAMAGIPLLNGFLSKEMFFKEAVDVGASMSQPWLVPTVATLAGAFSVGYSVRFVWDVFFRPETGTLPHEPHPPPSWMQAPVALLVVLCVVVGVAPALVVQPLLEQVSASVLGARMPVVNVHLWHGVNLPLVMSLVAVGVGVGLYLRRASLVKLLEGVPSLPSGPAVYESILGVLFRGSRRITEALHNDSLPRYAVAVVVSALVIGVLPLVQGPSLAVERVTSAPPAPLIGFVLLAVVGAVATVRLHHDRLLALLALSLTGLGTALVFVELSAPDLALTQLSVEVATTVLMLLALFFLPAHSPKDEHPAGRRVRDAVLAVGVGLGVAALLYAILTRPFSTIADFYIAASKSHGGGTNIVNVILVDFRGFDTLGEITVLGVAAIAVSAMLHDVSIVRPQASEEGRPWSATRHPFLLRVMSRPLLPLLLLVAIYILLRGHNLPGGGFIAGLVTGVALTLQFMAGGLSFAAARLRFDLVVTTALGLAIALASGLASMVFGQPFLTSAFTHVHLGPIEFELASAMAFDLGVFITVVSVLLIILVRLGRVGIDPPDGGGSGGPR
ncbi:MAG: monovalent cation/H+ antiporter subunit A [Nannocystaceae bacterium]